MSKRRKHLDVNPKEMFMHGNLIVFTEDGKNWSICCRVHSLITEERMMEILEEWNEILEDRNQLQHNVYRQEKK